ncbi:MAG TPA: twin-arginine translocation signal domain-containing protein [Thermoleophilaceae bacterium]
MTRRSFLKRSGVLGAAAVLAASGWDKTVGRAIAAIRPGVDERCKQTYVALVQAVADSPSNSIPADSADAIVERYERWYESQTPDTQQFADSVLLDLDATYEGKAFRKASKAKRTEHIRAWQRDPDHRAAHGDRNEESAKDERAKASMREFVADPRNQGDPTDFGSIKVAPGAGPPPREKRKSSDEELDRTNLMVAALGLVAAPFHADQGDLEKVNPITV